jgi:nitrous oxide reductase accessory protein NosL
MFKRLDMLTKDTSMKITLIAPALMVLALAACGQKEEAAAPVAAPAPVAETAAPQADAAAAPASDAAAPAAAETTEEKK